MQVPHTSKSVVGWCEDSFALGTRIGKQEIGNRGEHWGGSDKFLLEKWLQGGYGELRWLVLAN
jgi:hypothetical protein